MKRFKEIISIIAIIFILSSCNGDLTYINIPTASTSGALYPFGNSLATLWNKEVDGIRVNAQASNGGIENLNLLGEGKAQISMAIASNVYQAYEGIGKFQGRPNNKIRIVAGLYLNPNQVVVTKSSKVSSLRDLRGMSFAPGSAGSTTEDEASVHLRGAGLSYPDDIIAHYVGFTEAIDLMKNKQVDGAWIMAGAPTSAVTEMLKTTDSKLLEITKEEVESLKEDYPWYSNYTLKAGTYEELEEDINTSAVKMVMFCSEDLDEELVYELTKIFFENIDDLRKNHGFLEEVSPQTAVEDIAGLKLHEGALRYYREIGIIK